MTNNLIWIFGDLVSKKALEKIASSSNVDSKTSSNILSQALPELLKWLQKNTNTEKWTQKFLWAIEKHTWDIFNSDSKIDTADGWKILSHILWDNKEKLIWNISKSLNISWNKTNTTLESIAPMLLWALWKAKSNGKLDISNIWNILWSKDISTTLLTSFLDKDGDGDIKDDLIWMGINYMKNIFFKK